MIEERVGDIFKQKDIDVIVMQCNLFHTFGAGIAKIVKEIYPEAYEADKKTPYGDPEKLGTYSLAKCSDGKIIVNCYSQTGMGAQDRNTSYNDIYTIFKTIEEKLAVKNDKVLAIPFKFGCGLAGGKYRIVRAIIEEVFGKSIVKCVIVRLPNEQDLD